MITETSRVGLQHSPRVMVEPGGGAAHGARAAPPCPAQAEPLAVPRGQVPRPLQGQPGPGMVVSGVRSGKTKPQPDLTPRVLSHIRISGHSFPIWKKKTLALIPSLTWGHHHLGGQSRASWLGSSIHVGFLDLWAPHPAPAWEPPASPAGELQRPSSLHALTDPHP